MNVLEMKNLYFSLKLYSTKVKNHVTTTIMCGPESFLFCLCAHMCTDRLAVSLMNLHPYMIAHCYFRKMFKKESMKREIYFSSDLMLPKKGEKKKNHTKNPTPNNDNTE